MWSERIMWFKFFDMITLKIKESVIVDVKGIKDYKLTNYFHLKQ